MVAGDVGGAKISCGTVPKLGVANYIQMILSVCLWWKMGDVTSSTLNIHIDFNFFIVSFLFIILCFIVFQFEFYGIKIVVH